MQISRFVISLTTPPCRTRCDYGTIANFKQEEVDIIVPSGKDWFIRLSSNGEPVHPYLIKLKIGI